MANPFANSGGPDQMLHSAASDLGLHFLPITPVGVSRLQWVKMTLCKIDYFLFNNMPHFIFLFESLEHLPSAEILQSSYHFNCIKVI